MIAFIVNHAHLHAKPTLKYNIKFLIVNKKFLTSCHQLWFLVLGVSQFTSMYTYDCCNSFFFYLNKFISLQFWQDVYVLFYWSVVYIIFLTLLAYHISIISSKIFKNWVTHTRTQCFIIAYYYLYVKASNWCKIDSYK